MTDIQILTIGIALSTSFLAVFIGVLLNNTRLGDLRVSVTQVLEAKTQMLEAKIGESRAQSSKEMADLRILMADLRVLIEKNHSETLFRLADVDGRLTRIESERRIVP